MIYLDNAATTIYKPECVYENVIRAMKEFGNPGRSAGEASILAGRCVYDARKCLSDFFGGNNPEGIIFTGNATQALNIAIKGILRAGDHVITSATEHNSVLRPLYQMEEKGCELTIVPADEMGDISVKTIEAAIKENTKAIVCNHASNVTGNINDINAIGAIARKYNLIFIVDASQTAGEVEINVERSNIDMLAFTGHKGLMGPQGTGGLYIRRELEIEPLVSGGTGSRSFDKRQPDIYPEHLEAGTLNSHGIAGLLAAVRFINETGISTIRRKELELANIFYERVVAIPGVKVYGNFMDINRRCPIVSINIGDLDSAELTDILEKEYKVHTRAGIHCAPLIHEALGTAKQGTVRFSFSYFNTEDDAINAAIAVAEFVREY